MDVNNLAPFLDLANHHANATVHDIEELCKTVKAYGFHAAFVNPVHVSLARSLMGTSGVVGTAISFPLGQDVLDVKQVSISHAIEDGADELDIVPNNALLRTDDPGYLAEMTSIVSAIRLVNKTTVIKFILETGFLTDDQIKIGAKLILESGADFVKICSGMGPRGASLHDVKLVREVVGNTIKVKVAGGIDTLAEAQGFLAAGAHRIGTSKAVEIVKHRTSPSQHPSSPPNLQQE